MSGSLRPCHVAEDVREGPRHFEGGLQVWANFLCEGPDVTCWASQALWSLSQPPRSTVVAWRLPQTFCTSMDTAAFQGNPADHIGQWAGFGPLDSTGLWLQLCETLSTCPTGSLEHKRNGGHHCSPHFLGGFASLSNTLRNCSSPSPSRREMWCAHIFFR